MAIALLLITLVILLLAWISVLRTMTRYDQAIKIMQRG